MYGFVHFLSAAASLAIALIALFRLPQTGSRAFGLLMLSLTVWSLGAGLEAAALQLTAKVNWAVASYIGSQTAGVLFFLFALRFTHPEARLEGSTVAALFVIPAAAVIMAATNAHHGWTWPSVQLEQVEVLGLVAVYSHGPWFYVQLGYAYLFIAAGCGLLIQATWHYPDIFSLHHKVFLGAALIPWVINIWYVFGGGFARYADLTPIAFTVSSSMVAWLVFRRQFLALTPVTQKQILNQMHDGVLLYDHQKRVIFTNAALLALFELAEVKPGQKIDHLLADWPAIEQFQAEGAAGALVLQPARQPEKWLEITLRKLQGAADLSPGTLMTVRDITKPHQAEEALRQRQEFIAALNEITHDALQASNFQQMLQSLADRVGELLHADGGYITLWDEETRRTIPSAAYGEMRDRYKANPSPVTERTMTQSVLEEGRPLVAEDVYNSPYMSPTIAAKYPTRSLLGLPMIAHGRKLGAVLIGFNTPHHFTPQEIEMGDKAADQISLAVLKGQLLEEANQAHQDAQLKNLQLQEALRQLDLLATTDSLTGAYNRRKLQEMVDREISRLARYAQPVVLAMFDIDHFKRINDSYGHAFGDLVLAALVQVVQQNIRSADTLFRWGGEEFVILAPGISLDQAVAMSEKVLRVIEGHDFSCSTRVTISMGLTSLQPGDSLSDAIKRADAALYRAKMDGRNRAKNQFA